MSADGQADRATYRGRRGSRLRWAVAAFVLLLVSALAGGSAMAHDDGCSGSGDQGSGHGDDHGACAAPAGAPAPTPAPAAPPQPAPSAHDGRATLPAAPRGPAPAAPAGRRAPSPLGRPVMLGVAPAAPPPPATLAGRGRVALPIHEEALPALARGAVPAPLFDPGDTGRHSSDELPLTLGLSGVAALTSLAVAGFRARAGLRRIG